MSILVTGVAGFIGSHLAERLISEGYEVLGVDNFDPFYAKTIKQNNLSKLLHEKKFKFYECDIRNEDFSLVIANREVDIIIHLAARAGVRPSLQFPQSYVHHDIEGTVNLLQTSQKFGIDKIIFGSSSSVYGNLPDLPYNEDLKLDKPISPYAAAKLSGELYNYVFHSQYGIDITNLRFFTVYGPRQRPEMAIHKFTRLIQDNQPITMYGDGSSSRDYTYIDDIIDGTLLSMKKISGFSTYNLGNNEPVKLKQLINLIGNTLDKEVKIKQKPMQPGDVNHTLADISKAQEELNYQPRIGIEEGIERFVSWYLEN